MPTEQEQELNKQTPAPQQEAAELESQEVTPVNDTENNGLQDSEGGDPGRPDLEAFNKPEEVADPSTTADAPQEQEDKIAAMSEFTNDMVTELNGLGASFSYALYQLKSGAKITRAGWSGRHLEFIDGAIIDVRENDALLYGYACNQPDTLAEDWRVVE